MFIETTLAQNSRFKIGWIILVVFAALMTLNHLMLIFVLDQPILFIGYTAFNLYALIVLLVPFRRMEKWAWMTSWILPAGLILPAFNDPSITIIYISVAALCVLGLLLTMRGFFKK